MTTLKFFSWLRQPRNTIWWQPAKGALFVILYVIAVLVSTRYLPTNLFPDIPSRTVDGLLTILASSMLAVTTFSLSIMVGAFSRVPSNSSWRTTAPDSPSPVSFLHLFMPSSRKSPWEAASSRKTAASSFSSARLSSSPT